MSSGWKDTEVEGCWAGGPWKRSSEDTHVGTALWEARTICEKILLTVGQDSVDGHAVLMTKSMPPSGITITSYIQILHHFQTGPEAAHGIDFQTNHQ